MGIWELDKLALFIAFVVPGFIAMKLYEVLYPTNAVDSSKKLVDAIAYSCINYALLLPFIVWVEKADLVSSSPIAYLFFYMVVLLAAPIAWIFIWRWIRLRKLLLTILPHPTLKPWDFVFEQNIPWFIIVTLEDGRKIAGKYSFKSFASSAPALDQLFLEEEWVLNEDGGFERPAHQTGGILITGSKFTTIEFYKSGEIEDAEKAN